MSSSSSSSKGIGIGGTAGGKSGAPVAMELEKLSVEQLKAVKEQADMEFNLLQDSLNNIRTATARLDIASNALHDLSLRPQGKKMLVPLTASLYVPGTLDDADKVLVDVGTGYFIEKQMAEGKDYCERKSNLLKSNYDQLLEVATKKKTIADEVDVVLQAKLKQLVPAQLKLKLHHRDQNSETLGQHISFWNHLAKVSLNCLLTKSNELLQEHLKNIIVKPFLNCFFLTFLICIS